MFFLPDYNVRDDAKKARAEFARALGAYIDLVALERATRQRRPGRRWRSPPRSATAGCSAGSPRNWPGAAGPGRRRGRRCTPSPTELGLPELDDLADIMRLSGEEGAQVYEQPAGPLAPACGRRMLQRRTRPRPTRSASGCRSR